MLVQGTIKAHTRLRYLNRGLARAALLLFSLFVSFLAHFLMIEQQSVERQTPFLSWSTSLPDRKWTKKKKTPKKKGAQPKNSTPIYPRSFFLPSPNAFISYGLTLPPRNVEVHREPLSLGNLQSHTWWTNQNAFTQRKGEQTQKKKPKTCITFRTLS